MAYLLALPVIYYGTNYMAKKTMDTISTYLVEHDDLHDTSDAVLAAAVSLLKRHRHMKETHDAFVAKTYVEQGVDALEYMRKKVTSKKSIFKRSYKKENENIRELQDELERRLRLFHIVYACS